MEHSSILLFAVVLGALAFFEPCAIASNVLFTQYVQRISPQDRISQLGRMALARAGLLVSLGLAVSVFARAMGIALPDLFLPIAYGLFGIVYVVSRVVYIPVPHIRFHGIVPGSERRLGEGTKLGLTLPACTIPLAGALLMALAGAANPSLGAAAMFLFAVFFSLPVFVYSFRPATPRTLRFLDRSARMTPYLTGLLFAFVAAGKALAV